MICSNVNVHMKTLVEADIKLFVYKENSETLLSDPSQGATVALAIVKQ